ncbi:hypothetical protein [Leifsonia poae]|uniref:hypothetical protein n=1 Tax=Leifsonia poae TaxID=110933 RepID=UPI003D66F10C
MLRPKVVLWWGIGLTVGGVGLAVLLPYVGYSLVSQTSVSNGLDQGLLVLLNMFVQLISQVLPPLGVALIGASVVMTYVGRLLGSSPQPAAVEPIAENQ